MAWESSPVSLSAERTDRREAGGVTYVEGELPVFPPGLESDSEEICDVCCESFIVGLNHFGACFGHCPDLHPHVEAQRITKVRSDLGVLGSVWKLPCCGKVFPSYSADTPEPVAELSPDLMDENGYDMGDNVGGLCKASLDAGSGYYPHTLKQYGSRTYEDCEIYINSLPPAREEAYYDLLLLKLNFVQIDCPWTEDTAVSKIMEKAEQGHRDLAEFCADQDQPDYDVGIAFEPGLDTVAQKIAEARNLKVQGNALFSQGLHSKAIYSYSEVFACTNFEWVDSLCTAGLHIQTPNEEEQREIEQLQIASWSNMAISCLKLQKPREALVHLAKVIDKEPTHSKALYNQGCAYMEIGDHERARESLTKAAEIAPQDMLITGQLNKLNKLRKASVVV